MKKLIIVNGTMGVGKSSSALRQRMQEDHRTEEQINRSLERIRTYAGMHSHTVDTSEMGLDEAVLLIKNRLL
ncbi:hypothetical protein MKZ24_17525 [Paenibacillus sp. FSL R7-0297]|uniref:hypothetical protein n=1 Tax=unclassified Paenibacillus TaxID=185978 RepID=UPI0004F8FCEF|nr:hypothetical protein [Paenibacillus sp. FSL R5-0912]AIQ42263.1 hypothetical protein R50912_21110 [Paenibacillus sp. FSL R5-0912]